jgi:hypothetical protein
LNPFAAPSCPRGFVEYGLDRFPGDEPVRLNRDHVGWLRQLASNYDLTWASACPENLNRYCAALIGLDPMPRLPMPTPPFDPDLKVPAVDASMTRSTNLSTAGHEHGPPPRCSSMSTHTWD